MIAGRLQKRITRECLQDHGRVINFDFERQISVGDIVKYKKSQWFKVSSLAEIGVSFEVKESSVSTDQRVYSTRGIQIGFSGGANDQPIGTIRFLNSGCYYIEVYDTVLMLNDEQKVASQCQNNNKWEKDFRLISHVWKSKRVFWAYSTEKNQLVEFEAPLPGEFRFNFADPSVSFQYQSNKTTARYSWSKGNDGGWPFFAMSTLILDDGAPYFKPYGPEEGYFWS